MNLRGDLFLSLVISLIICGGAVNAEAQHDWGQWQKYADANSKLPPPTPGVNRVVFFGDSITEYWTLDKSFPSQGYINRGISGQTTPQMLVRLRQDVIDLHPKVVVLLAGTNDIAQNTGPETIEEIEGYLTSICELARENKIKVVLCSILPVLDYHWKKGLNPVPKIAKINAWLKNYAAQHDLPYVDYFSEMAESDGSMKKSLSEDGVHPNAAGYAVMTAIVDKSLKQALK